MLDVEVVGRLVEEQFARSLGQGAGDVGAFGFGVAATAPDDGPPARTGSEPSAQSTRCAPCTSCWARPPAS